MLFFFFICSTLTTFLSITFKWTCSVLKIQFNYNTAETSTTNLNQIIFNNSGSFASAQNQTKITQFHTVGAWIFKRWFHVVLEWNWMKYHYPLISFLQSHKTINEFSREMRTNWIFFISTYEYKKKNIKIRTVDWERYIKENCFKRLDNIAIHFSETCIWKEKKMLKWNNAQIISVHFSRNHTTSIFVLGSLTPRRLCAND